jgi:hypothetical protein
MKFSVVVAISMGFAGLAGAAGNHLMRSDDPAAWIRDRLAMAPVTPESSKPYQRTTHYYYCQRHFGFKSTR